MLPNSLTYTLKKNKTKNKKNIKKKEKESSAFQRTQNRGGKFTQFF